MTNMRVDFREEANPQTLCTGASWSVTCVDLICGGWHAAGDTLPSGVLNRFREHR